MTQAKQTGREQPPSVAEEQRELVRQRILAASRTIGAKHGLALRMADVAEEAGVSKRTLFRHFGSREELIRQTFQLGLDGYAQRVPRPSADEEPRDWLERALVRVHHLNSHIGRLWWDLASHVAGTGDVDFDTTFNQESRATIVERFAADAWSVFGGTGAPPNWVRQAFGVHMSAFATRVLTDDFGCTLDDAGRATAQALEAVLQRAMADSATDHEV